MNRPSIRDEVILRAVAMQVLEAMPIGAAEKNDEGTLSDLMNLITDHAPGFDEYRMTRDLENMGWECDRSILDALEITSGTVHTAIDEATRAWVESNQIRPRLAIGDTVKVQLRTGPGPKQDYDGEIRKIDSQRAQYTVFVESLGHVREGNGTHGVIVNFEELHPLATPAEEFELMS